MTSALSGILRRILLTFDCRSWWNIRRPMAIVMFRWDTRIFQSKCRKQNRFGLLALDMLITTIFRIFHLGLLPGSKIKGEHSRRSSLKGIDPSLLKTESIFSMTSALSGIIFNMLLNFDCRSWWNIRWPMAIVISQEYTMTI